MKNYGYKFPKKLLILLQLCEKNHTKHLFKKHIIVYNHTESYTKE